MSQELIGVSSLSDPGKFVIPTEEVDISLKDSKGQLIFKRGSITKPSTWSNKAAFIFATKYLKKVGGVWEDNIVHTIHRIASHLADVNTQYELYLRIFRALLGQEYSYNSPVWFNLGTDEGRGFLSACFIMSIGDSITEIYKHLGDEAEVFKWGSGSGKDWSNVRSSREDLSNGGKASGPLSFMKAFDASAGVIKSGGRHRRAAKMDILSVTHPDILTTADGGVGFIGIKVQEDEKAAVLAGAGYSTKFDVPNNCYSGSWYQNSNTAIKVTNSFMEAVISGKKTQLRAVTTGEVLEEVSADLIINEIAKSVWFCGDPGIYYVDTINFWHTCPNTGPINACNPCAEYVFLDNSSCNLASHNLAKYLIWDKNHRKWVFDGEKFVDNTGDLVESMDKIVDLGSYPTQEITNNSKQYRPLGIGYANLGAILMSMGIPYNSKLGRSLAAAVASLMTASAYLKSSQLAKKIGPFAGYEKNAGPMRKVVSQHFQAHKKIQISLDPEGPDAELHNATSLYQLLEEIWNLADITWKNCIESGAEYGYRNAQVTLLAPTGTIRLGMDCDSGGIEPLDSLRSIKYMVDGGTMTFTPNCIKLGLETLGYSTEDINQIDNWIEEHNSLEGCPIIAPKDLPIFATALGENNTISPEGHILMMAEIQPMLSGSISKTVNLPNKYSVEDIKEAIMFAWKLGIKTITFYRDGSKMIQPIRPKEKKDNKEAVPVTQTAVSKRNRLPKSRPSITEKFEVGGHEGYVIFGEYPDGKLGEIFVMCSKMGSTIQGLLYQWAIQISISIQHGTPLEVIVQKERHTKYDPSGWTNQEDYRTCTSITDLVAKMIERRYLTPEKAENIQQSPQEDKPITKVIEAENPNKPVKDIAHSKSCPTCGSSMIRTGTCYTCGLCGHNDGCS